MNRIGQSKTSGSSSFSSSIFQISPQFQSRPFEEVDEDAEESDDWWSDPKAFVASAPPPDAQTKPNEMMSRHRSILPIPLYAPEPAAPPVQAKLTVGKPGDPYEQEADCVAEQVMSMPEPAGDLSEEGALGEGEKGKGEGSDLAPLPLALSPLSDSEEELQMKPITISSIDSTSLQQKCTECEQEEQVQRSGNGNVEASSDFESRLNSSKGGGSPLSDDVRSFMEPRFGGVSFEAVKVHTDSAAVQMNQELGAQAFTHGSDIYYGNGKAPGKDALTAHELTHFVQQTGSEESVQRKIGDGHDLTSPRFAGDEILEACYDGEKDKYLKRNAEGEAVAKVQQALVELGYPLPKSGVDGLYGDETGAAVASFKQDNGINPSDPVVGPQTMAELNRRFQTQPSTPPPIIDDLPPCPTHTQANTSNFKLAGDALLAVPGVTCQIIFAGCAVSNPGKCETFEDWLSNFPPHVGSAVERIEDDSTSIGNDITEAMPEELQKLIKGVLPNGSKPDCADVSFILRHFYLKARGKNATFKDNKGNPILIGKGVSDNTIRKDVVQRVSTLNFQRGFVNFYRKGGKNITNLRDLLNAGLKVGDLFVWKSSSAVPLKPDGTSPFSGHAQTVQSIDKKANPHNPFKYLSGVIIVDQGAMEAHEGKGQLVQSKYTFETLTGRVDGDGEIHNRNKNEESFFGAGSWK
ncbi:MAG: DUF4157 domain-containing protein [Leptolyngbyaceae cyanobacterium bins.302]|nr:DUF4157 domain-containing protein [Leptolyngbyaceae cyanobacterium bins.302]